MSFVSVDVDAETFKEESNDISSNSIKLEETTDEKLKCSECKKYTTNSKEKLVRHIRSAHLGKKPYQCSMCDYTTINSVLIKEHINIHQGIRPYKCKHCSYRSASKKYVKKHELKHAICECGFVAKNYKNLQAHRFKDCGQLPTVTNVICQDCCQSVPEDCLADHLKRKKECLLCSCFICSSYFNTHMRVVHNKSARECKFVCAVCEWSSSARKKIVLHLIHHPQEVENLPGVHILRKYGILSEGSEGN